MVAGQPLEIAYERHLKKHGARLLREGGRHSYPPPEGSR
jgi:hypothetical protein